MRLSFQHKMKSLLYVGLGAMGLYTGISIYTGNEAFYRDTLMPLVRLLDAERAHRLAVVISKYRLVPKSQFEDSNILFSNPIGIAAGFDKDGEAILGLKDIGFGFVEIGSVTPLPQPGNEKPRLFRLLQDRAVINRYGFNSEGHNEVLQRLENIKINPDKPIIGVNLGKNKSSEDAINDYVKGIKSFGEISDYLVVNISSPNTPNLRALQNKENLKQLLEAVVAARNSLPIDPKPPLLIKLAPDLNWQEKKDIAEIVQQKTSKVEGLIVCNTTIQRPELRSENRGESGGLSGEPLKDTSTQMIRDMSKLTKGIIIIGVGGVSSGKDAYDKIKAGASLVQIYSALIYDGPPLVTKIKKELEQLVKNDGFTNVSQAVGTDSDR